VDPQNVRGCPLNVLADCVTAVHTTLRAVYGESSPEAEWAMSRLLEEVNTRTKDNRLSKGAETTVFYHGDLHYTLKKP
jgi:hypothetical protein